MDFEIMQCTPLRTSTTCETRQSPTRHQAVGFVAIHRHHFLVGEPINCLAHGVGHRYIKVLVEARRESGSLRIGQLAKLGSSLGKDEYR